MSQDRTGEFFSVAKSLDGSGSSSLTSFADKNASSASNRAKNNSSNSNNSAYSEIRTFHSTAAGISRDIAATSALLTELANRVRQQSSSLGHNDPSQETDQLVVRIKSSIENLNSRLDQAAVFIQQQKRTLGRHSQAAQESANLVDGLKTEFAEAATGFKKVLQERTDNMKETNDFQRTVYGGKRSNGGGGSGAAQSHEDEEDMEEIPNMSSALTTPPPVYSLSGANKGHTFPMLDLTSSMMAPGESTSSLPRPHGIRTSTSGISDYSSGHYNNYTNTETAPLTPLDIQRMDQEQHEQYGGQLQLIPDQDYLQQRADAMSTVEANIVELGAIFNKLAVMVNEHRELVQRVEDNVEDANTNINLSLNVLTDTLTSLRTNRALAFRVFSVLVVFIIAFIVFFA